MLDSGNELSIIWTFAYGVGYSLSLTFLVRKICQIKLKSTKEETSHSLMEVKSSRHLMCLEKDRPLYVCANALCRFQLRQPKALPQNRCSDYEKQLQYISKFCVILKMFLYHKCFYLTQLTEDKKDTPCICLWSKHLAFSTMLFVWVYSALSWRYSCAFAALQLDFGKLSFKWLSFSWSAHEPSFLTWAIPRSRDISLTLKKPT